MSKYRGDVDASRQPRYSAEDAANCLSQVRKAIHRNYNKLDRGFWLRSLVGSAPREEIGLRFRELSEGHFQMSVKAMQTTGEVQKEWSREFENADDFRTNANAFGAKVAGDLVEMNRKDRSG